MSASEMERLGTPWRCSLCGVNGPRTLEAMNDHLLDCTHRPAPDTTEVEKLKAENARLSGEVERLKHSRIRWRSVAYDKNAESASLRERLRESEASVAQLVGDVQAVSRDYTQALEALRVERGRHRLAEDDPFGTKLCHECDGHWPCSASLRIDAALSGSSAPQAAAPEEITKALRDREIQCINAEARADDLAVRMGQMDAELVQTRRERHDAMWALRAIIIRCTEGDPRTNWLPIIANIASAALSMKSEGPATPEDAEGGSQKGS